MLVRCRYFSELAPAIVRWTRACFPRLVASSGYRVDPAEFRSELVRTAAVLRQQTAARRLVSGRPAGPGQTQDPLAFEILKELGYRYDSSLTPLAAIAIRTGRGCRIIMTSQGASVSSRRWLRNPAGKSAGRRGWASGRFLWMIERAYTAVSWQGCRSTVCASRELDPTAPACHYPVARLSGVWPPRRFRERLKKLLANHTFKPLGVA